MAWIRSGRDLVRRGMTGAAWAGLWCVVAAGGDAAAATGESLPLRAAYGDGVHAYFAGDYERAYEDLSQAIEAGTDDPRAFYFRGLAALRQGRSDEAEADFTTGAERESSRLGTWAVSRSLERVQGPDRLRLERHRMRARVANLQRERQAEAERYSQSDAAQPEVQRSRRPMRGGTGSADEVNPFQVESPQPAAPETVPSVDPADAPAEKMPEPPTPDPSPAPEFAPATEPAAADAGEAPAPKSDTEDPFGDNTPKAEQVEELAAEREDRAAQRDAQAEEAAAEAEGAAAEADRQAEQDAAGDR